MADGDAAARPEDVDVAAHLGLQHGGRDIEPAGRDLRRGLAGDAQAVVGVAVAGREQRGDRRIGSGVLAEIRAIRILEVLAYLDQEIEEGAVDEQLLPRLRQALESGPG